MHNSSSSLLFAFLPLVEYFSFENLLYQGKKKFLRISACILLKFAKERHSSCCSESTFYCMSSDKPKLDQAGHTFHTSNRIKGTLPTTPLLSTLEWSGSICWVFHWPGELQARATRLTCFLRTENSGCCGTMWCWLEVMTTSLVFLLFMLRQH